MTLRPRDPSPCRVAALRSGAAVLAAALLGACGGGGGGAVVQPPGPPPETAPAGLVGEVLLEDLDLGRIGEQEPNDTRALAFALPPVWPGCALEVTGLIATSATRYGRVDPVDALRFVSVRAQRIDLSLTYEALDPILGRPNDLVVGVYERTSGAELARSAGGAAPQTLAFEAEAGERYEVVLTAVSAHTPWTLRLVAGDPLVTPKPGAGPAADRSAPEPGTQALAADPEPGGDPEALCCPDHVLLRLDPDVDAEAFCQAHGLTCVGRTALGTLKVAPRAAADAGKIAPGVLVDRLARAAGVRGVEPDWIVRTQGGGLDPDFSRQWYLRAIGAPAAWNVTPGSEGVGIAVLDSGVIAHPDLVGRLDPGYDFVSAVDLAADGDGRDADPTDPGDALLPSGLSSWHGTHVTAIAVARQDGAGVTGVAPGCRAVPLRVVGRGGGLASDAADAILYAAGLFQPAGAPVRTTPLPVVNLSFGLAQDSSELRDACDRAVNTGVFLVGAAGNTGQRTLYPAAYESVFAVSAVDARLLATPYSNFGLELDVVAPGGLATLDEWGDGWPDGILSASYDDTVFPKRFSWSYLVGTSQAAPQVSAAAALLLSLDPSLTVADLRSILRGSARDVGPPGFDQGHGYGLLQVHRAVDLVLGRLGQANPTPPTLLLPAPTVKFHGFEALKRLPLINGGGGSLLVTGLQVRTDDLAPWLNAVLVPADTPGGPISHAFVEVSVDRNQVPAGIGRYGGTLTLHNLSGVIGAIRVIMLSGERVRAGENFTLVAIEDATGAARVAATVAPEHDYRYWLRALPAGTWRLKAGDDLDGDGIFCEAADVCGWYGGATEAEAVPVAFDPAAGPRFGFSVFLFPPP